MTQRRLIFSYLGVVCVAASTMGGYVACGAQNYRVPIHGAESGTEGGSGGGKQSGASGQNLVGVHSGKGWANNLPIHFRTSAEIPEAVVAELRAAMLTWEDAVGMQLFNYDGTEAKKGSDFGDLFSPLNDATNGHYFDYEWVSHTGKSATVLATTLWENDPRDQQSIVKADIRYNNQFYIFGDALKEYSQGQRTIVDATSLALHELGHLLGLTHISESQDRYSVMNPSLFIGEGMMTRRLSEGDIERVRSVYGVGDSSRADALEKADDYASVK